MMMERKAFFVGELKRHYQETISGAHRAEPEAAEGSDQVMLPVGAGTELAGPGGDGFISVITPNSPIGRALQGSRAGDSFEIVIHGRDREWTVVDVC
jgi:transcription elongation GreA/GreB family factor